MTTYNNEGKIAIFPNDKGNNPKRPDFRGTLTLGGVEYKCSLWIRETRDGKARQYWNGTVEKAEPRDARAADTPKQYPPEARKPSLYAEASAVPGMRSEAENEVPF